ncbi:MAG: glycosyltransferase family 9 protein, partial [Selenomonadaceae bacterium]|nr:glycosyltransferase family 9 protein [Selenomonadaceae bacterium]
LIVFNSRIGEFICTSASIREIRRIYPTSHIILLVSNNVLNIAENCPYVNEIFTCDIIRKEGFSEYFPSIIEISKKLLQYQFDIAYSLVFGSNGGMTPLISYMSGAKKIFSIAINSASRLFAPLSNIIVPHTLYGTHAVDSCLSYLDFQLSLPIADRHIEVWITPLDFAEIKTLIPYQEKNLYAICIGGSGKRKHWAAKYYAELINMILTEESTAKFILLGGKDEIEEGEVIESRVDKKAVVNLINKTSYRKSMAALSYCKICIGNDTSLIHAAAALKIPVLTPNCLAADIKNQSSSIKRWYPYNVPSVTVMPKNALPECRNSNNFFGCTQNYSHCINQIPPHIMFQALHILKDQITKNNTEPVYVSW